ncbi:hypothetical protein [Azospirillum sp.]|uniref:hypothetical protein n=1 Tax=Azospirillum sp. TaxID=34012 RepID=UPI003D72B473
MRVSSTDEPSPDTPERNRLIAYLRETNKPGRSFISTSSRAPGATDEQVSAEIMRVLKGMEDGSIAYTVHDRFEDEPARQSNMLIDAALSETKTTET